MFAGGSVEFLRPLIVGQRVHREDTVLSVTPKSGARGGDFVVVAVQTRLFDSSGALAVQEVQDLIYCDKPAPAEEPLLASVLNIVPLLLHKEERWEFRTDPTKLMRFSAATSNGHRIHYDHPYATGIERLSLARFDGLIANWWYGPPSDGRLGNPGTTLSAGEVPTDPRWAAVAEKRVSGQDARFTDLRALS